MNLFRIIPCLLIHNNGLVKSAKFKNYRYVGDPINAVRIFNEKEVDEIALIDIDATRQDRAPDIARIASIASEAFMPLSYGGGISTIEQVKEILYNGVEKVIINKAAHTNPILVTQIANCFGSQSVVVSLDVKRTLLAGRRVFTDNGSNKTAITPLAFAKRMEDLGAGELLLTSIDRDGTFKGFDLSLIREVAAAVNIPVIASGGASSEADFTAARAAGASAVAAGSMFVFQRPHNAVLINYPSQQELAKTFKQRL